MMQMEEGRGESRCVICGEKKPGLQIRADNVVRCMRWFNRKVLKKYRNYRLVVCKDCYIRYKKARRSYVRKQAIYVSIGVIFTILLLIFSGWNFSALLYGAVLTFFMYLLSLISYVPAIDVPETAAHSRVKRSPRGSSPRT